MNPTNRKNRTVQLSGNTEQVKDNQIIKENWFESMTRNAMDTFPSIRKSKRIPVEIWEEINSYFNNVQFKNIAVDKNGVVFAASERQIRNSGSRTYLVTKQGDK